MHHISDKQFLEELHDAQKMFSGDKDWLSKFYLKQCVKEGIISNLSYLERMHELENKKND